MQQNVCILELLERRLECLHQMVRQLRNKSDCIRQQHLTGIGHRQLPGRRVERVKKPVVCRNIRARERV